MQTKQCKARDIRKPCDERGFCFVDYVHFINSTSHIKMCLWSRMPNSRQPWKMPNLRWLLQGENKVLDSLQRFWSTQKREEVLPSVVISRGWRINSALMAAQQRYQDVLYLTANPSKASVDSFKKRNKKLKKVRRDFKAIRKLVQKITEGDSLYGGHGDFYTQVPAYPEQIYISSSIIIVFQPFELEIPDSNQERPPLEYHPQIQVTCAPNI